MTARQAIGTWCVAALFAGVAIGFSLALTTQPHACDSVIVNHYKHAEHPVCVRHEYQPTKETE
jgi:hypothetical protein